MAVKFNDPVLRNLIGSLSHIKECDDQTGAQDDSVTIEWSGSMPIDKETWEAIVSARSG